MSDAPEQEAAPVGSKLAIRIRAAANLPTADWGDERIGAIKATCTPQGTTDAQFAIFLAVCAKYNLNPLTREIWLANMGGKIMVVTGRDAFVKVMNNQADFEGLISGVVYDKDEFAVVRNGDRVEITHKMVGLNRGNVAGSYAVLRRKGKPDQYITRTIANFKHLMGKDSWKNYLDDMVETRAIVSVARRGYNLAGLEEQSVAEDILERQVAAARGSVSSDSAVEGTATATEQLRQRLGQLQGKADLPPGITADGVVEQPVPIDDEDLGAGELTDEQLAEMEEKIRNEPGRSTEGVDAAPKPE